MIPASGAGLVHAGNCDAWRSFSWKLACEAWMLHWRFSIYAKVTRKRGQWFSFVTELSELFEAIDCGCSWQLALTLTFQADGPELVPMFHGHCDTRSARSFPPAGLAQ